MGMPTKLFYVAFLCANLTAHGANINLKTAKECKVVTLEGLDKISARVFSLDATVKTPVTFGNLAITVQRCVMTPGDEPYEMAVFLDIHETTSEKKDFPVFKGWMFASSPSLSAMDHPIYDVWVKYEQKERAASTSIPIPVLQTPESEVTPEPVKKKNAPVDSEEDIDGADETQEEQSND